MVKDVRDDIPKKALPPIVVTEFPIVRDATPVALMKASTPISVMSFRITTAPVHADPSVKTVPS